MIIGIIRFSDSYNMVNILPSVAFARGWIQGMKEKQPEILINDGLTIVGTEIVQVLVETGIDRVSEN